jgi:hypothetical protein
MKKYILLLVLPAVFILNSCIKNELTLPSKVEFNFGLEPLVSEDGLKGNSFELKSVLNQVTLDKGSLVLDAIEFDGKREEGKDVFFISNFKESLVADLSSQTTNFKVDFDIPQGVYNRIDINLYLSDLQETSFIIEGVIKIGVIQEIPVRFEYDFPDKINVRASANQPGQNIVLRKDKSSLATVLIDIGFLFRFINPGVIANADIVEIEGIDVILINKEYNIELFNQIATQISNSFSIVFE